MMEEWRPVPGFPYVEASSQGRIRTITRVVEAKASAYRPAYTRTIGGMTLKPTLYKGERYWMNLPGGRNARVAQLVCLAFHGLPPAGKSFALHRDGVATDDQPSNLYWGSHADNMADMVAHGRSMRGKGGKLTETQAIEIRRRRVAGESGKSLADEFGVSQQTVCGIYKGREWRHL
jgi:hypothetical protein